MSGMVVNEHAPCVEKKTYYFFLRAWHSFFLTYLCSMFNLKIY